MRRALLSLAITLWSAPLPLAAAATPPASAPTGQLQALSLAEAQHLALANHPRLKGQRSTQEAAAQAIKAARSTYFPQVTAYAERVFADANTRIAATAGLNDPTVVDRASTGISVSQLVTDFGRTSDTVAAARLSEKSEEDRTEQTEDEVVLDVTTAYYDVLRSQALLGVARQTVSDRETMLKRITTERDAFLKSDLDVSVGQQNVDQGKLLLLSAQGDLDSAFARLSEALGLGATRRYRLDDDTAAPPPPADFESLSDAMAANNPALAAAKHTREAAYKRADASGKAYLPTVSVLGSAGYNPLDNPSQHVTPTYGAVGIGLSVPLFSGGLLEAQEDADRAKARAADHAVDDLANRMAGDLRAAFNDAQTSYRDIDVTSRLLGNARKSLRLIQAGFEIGRNSIVDVSQAELQETQAAISNADAKYGYLARLSALQFETGAILHPPEAGAPGKTQ